MQRLYALAINASANEVETVIGAIRKDYGITTVVPTNLTDEDEAGTATTVDIDAAGLPWDERIHSSKKTVKADGTWTRRKNVADSLYEKVTAELKAGAAATSTPSLPTPPVAPVAAPTLPTMPSLPTLPTAKVETPYTKLVDFLARNTAPSPIPLQQLNPEYVEQILQHNGITGGVASLANNAETCEALIGLFSQVITGNGQQVR